MLITENNSREISKIGHVSSLVSLVLSLTETIASPGAKTLWQAVPVFVNTRKAFERRSQKAESQYL